MMRVPTELRAKALIRRASGAGAIAMVVRLGDDDAGMLLVKVRTLDGKARVFGPAPAGMEPPGPLPKLVPHLAPDGVPEADADVYLARQIGFDPDTWIVEVEDREGRSFSDD